MIREVDLGTLPCAARIHSESWKESHRAFCSEAFVNAHTPQHQQDYLAEEMKHGKRIYMLVRQKPVGIVSVKDSLIENLYVLPEEQNKGCGSELLLFAMDKCAGDPTLWVLDNNRRAYSLYLKNGFHDTGTSHRLSAELSEIEMRRPHP